LKRRRGSSRSRQFRTIGVKRSRRSKTKPCINCRTFWIKVSCTAIISIHTISSDFWATAEANGVLESGIYWPFGRPSRAYEQRPNYPLVLLESELNKLLSDKAAKPATRITLHFARICKHLRCQRVTSRAFCDKGVFTKVSNPGKRGVEFFPRRIFEP
jgi:hypothetical protein